MFGEWFREKRKALTVERCRVVPVGTDDLGDLLGISGQAVRAWESGETVPAEHRVPAIAAVLGVTEDEVRAALGVQP